MNLLLDIGNTRVKWAQENNNSLQSCSACAYEQDNLSEKIYSALHKLSRPDQVFVSNVAGEKIAKELSAFLHNTWSVSPTFLEVASEAAGVTNAYDDCKQLGIDRWLAIIAAWNRYQKAVCVVDCGTALTVDVVTVAGQHTGGYIIPGFHLMTSVLIKHTQQINSTAKQNAALDLGRNTVDCISNGALASLVALINRVLVDLKREHGSDSHCIITGGFAEELRNRLSFEVDYDPHLVLNGMATLIGKLS